MHRSFSGAVVLESLADNQVSENEGRINDFTSQKKERMRGAFDIDDKLMKRGKKVGMSNCSTPFGGKLGGVIRMSKDDLKSLVLARLPPKSREKISNSEWKELLEDCSGGHNKSTPEARMRQSHVLVVDTTDLEETMTAISEISPLTTSRHTVEGSIGERSEDEQLISSSRWLAFESPRSQKDQSVYELPTNTTVSRHVVLPPLPTMPPQDFLVNNPHLATPPIKPRRQRSEGTAYNGIADIAPPSLPMRQVSRMPSVKKGIHFGDVQVRFYERSIDVNPAVSSGVAVGIGWGYEEGRQILIEEWESQKNCTRFNMSSRNLLLPRHVRERMLLDSGYSQKDIASATRTILKIKNQRRTTIEQITIRRYTEEAIETTVQKLKDILSFRGAKKGAANPHSISSSERSSSSSVTSTTASS